jgi:hypothetical protein
LAFYFASSRLKILRDLNQSGRAQAEFIGALDGLNREERMDLAKESCLAETELECASEHTGCDFLQQLAVRDRSSSLDGLEASLALVRQANCADEPIKAFAEIKDVLSPAAQTYVEALELKLKGQNKQATQELKKIISSADGGVLSLEAVSALLDNDPKTTHTALSIWREADEEQMGWRHLGWRLTQNLLSSQHPFEALEIGLRLKQAGFIPLELQKTLVIAAFKSGNLDSAQALLASYSGPEPSLREPASLDESKEEFSSIYKQLIELRRQKAQPNGTSL